MGGLHTQHLDSRQRKYLSGRTAVVMSDFEKHYRRHHATTLLQHVQSELRVMAPPRPVMQHPDALPRSEVLLEGTLMLYLDGKWRGRHLQVTKSFAVESRDSREVFKGGWGCKKDLILTGSQICTTIQQHRHLMDDMCRHITDWAGGKMPFWECPTAFPVFIQHPYSAPVCLGTESHLEQQRWVSVLQGALRHQSTVLQSGDTLESRALLEATLSLRQERGSYDPGVLPMGNREEVLVAVVMEEVLPYLRDQIFPRIIIRSRSKRRITWIKLLAEVYRQVCVHVRAELAALLEELTHSLPLLEEQLWSSLQHITSLQDNIAHAITEDLCMQISQCLSHVIIPLLSTTLQEVATPICSGFAIARQLILDACDDIINKSSIGQPLHQLLAPLCSLGLGSARVSQCLRKLELSAGGQAWLEMRWGIHSGLCRPLVLRAQSSLYQVIDSAAVTFRRLISRQFCYSVDQSQLNAILHRARDSVLKHLDQDLRTIRTQLVLQSLLQLSLPTLLRSLGPQDLSRYKELLPSASALFIHPDIIFLGVLRESLSQHIQSVMRHALPQHCVPLADGRPRPLDPATELDYDEWCPHGDGWCSHGDYSRCCSQRSGSPTLTPNSLSSETVASGAGAWGAGREDYTLQESHHGGHTAEMTKAQILSTLATDWA